jgi:hypothetical protein
MTEVHTDAGKNFKVNSLGSKWLAVSVTTFDKGFTITLVVLGFSVAVGFTDLFERKKNDE